MALIPMPGDISTTIFYIFNVESRMGNEVDDYHKN